MTFRYLNRSIYFRTFGEFLANLMLMPNMKNRFVLFN